MIEALFMGVIYVFAVFGLASFIYAIWLIICLWDDC
jgi:hypothetical protein